MYAGADYAHNTSTCIIQHLHLGYVIICPVCELIGNIHPLI